AAAVPLLGRTGPGHDAGLAPHPLSGAGGPQAACRPADGGSGAGAGTADSSEGGTSLAPPTSVSSSPTTAHPARTQAAVVAPAPSNQATERSRVAPAPGGSHCPTCPHGCGSSSGAAATAESGLPTRKTSTTASAAPVRPSAARSEEHTSEVQSREK